MNDVPAAASPSEIAARYDSSIVVRRWGATWIDFLVLIGLVAAPLALPETLRIAALLAVGLAAVAYNGSGDPFAIVMTAEPSTGPGAPAASYTVSAGPTTGQPVTFTDTSSGAPVNRFWAFGDGSFNATGTNVALHTYGAPGTYKSALFVDNAGGSSATLKDVVVASAAPITIGISATTTGGTHWTYVPNDVTLKVGQSYVITWTTPAAEATVHGMGGLEVLGIDACGQITAALPCVRNFTPGASQIGLWSYACTNNACGTVSQHNGMTGTITIAP